MLGLPALDPQMSWIERDDSQNVNDAVVVIYSTNQFGLSFRFRSVVRVAGR